MAAYKVGQDIEAKLRPGGAVASTGTASQANYGTITAEGKIPAEVPSSVRIVHKQDISGWCHPASNVLLCACLCPELKRRTFNWIIENARIRSYACWCPMTHHCNFCTIEDFPYTTILEKTYAPFCTRCKSPCGANGFATQDDMSYCCLFIECTCLYNILVKPCCGEALFLVPCENGTVGFWVATRCVQCFALPVDCCMADSASYRAALMHQIAVMRGTELTPRQLRAIGKEAPEVQHMTR